MAESPLLVLSDMHLGPAAPRGADIALGTLFDRYGDSEVVFLGDLIDLSAETSRLGLEAVTQRLWQTYPAFAHALASHLAQGKRVTLVTGNHDAELSEPGTRGALLESLNLAPDSPLCIEPWFVHRGSIHFEHGHLWDPDNAPIHPLAPANRRHEPLGVALTRQVLAPTGAFQFAHAHNTTPLQGLFQVLRELGLRAPELIVRYFVAGAKILLSAASSGSRTLYRQGALAIEDYANGRALSSDVVRTLESLRPTPRHADPGAVFARLYLDRALATVLTAVSSTLGLVKLESTYLLLTAAGLLYLTLSKGDRSFRYSASLLDRVRDAAIQIGPVVDARLIVFGHTHVPEAVPGYINTGAFGFPNGDGRPFLLVHANGTLERGYMDRVSAIRVEPIPVSCAS